MLILLSFLRNFKSNLDKNDRIRTTFLSDFAVETMYQVVFDANFTAFDLR